jgi:hypothetical protein
MRPHYGNNNIPHPQYVLSSPKTHGGCAGFRFLEPGSWGSRFSTCPYPIPTRRKQKRCHPERSPRSEGPAFSSSRDGQESYSSRVPHPRFVRVGLGFAFLRFPSVENKNVVIPSEVRGARDLLSLLPLEGQESYSTTGCRNQISPTPDSPDVPVP